MVQIHVPEKAFLERAISCSHYLCQKRHLPTMVTFSVQGGVKERLDCTSIINRMLSGPFWKEVII